MCTLSCLEQVKPLLHDVHTYGFSPVCVRIWITSWPDWMKVLLHKVHW